MQWLSVNVVKADSGSKRSRNEIIAVNLVVSCKYTITYVHKQPYTSTWESSGLQNAEIDDLTFPEWRALIENQGDATLIHWSQENCFVVFLRILHSIYHLVVGTKEGRSKQMTSSRDMYLFHCGHTQPDTLGL